MPEKNLERITKYRQKGVQIGHHVFIDSNVWFDPVFPSLIQIEDFAVISAHVKIITHDGSLSNTCGYYNQKASVNIRKNAFIGLGSIILPGVTIGENSIVGAGSVVTRNVPDNSVVAGNPAKLLGDSATLLKQRKDKERYQDFLWHSPYLPPEKIMYSRTPLSPDQYSLAKSYINRDISVPQGPEYLVVETTNACNLSCIMCPRREMTREIGYMDFDFYKCLIDQTANYVKFIYLHFFGEPLLHPDLEKFINYGSGKGITIAFSTNATCLSEDKVNMLVHSNLDLLIVSIDGTKAEQYENIRKGGKFEKVLSNIKDLLFKVKKNKSSLHIVLQYIDISRNPQEIQDFVEMWKDFPGVTVKIKELHDYANQLHDIKRMKHGEDEISQDVSNVCFEPWRGMVVGWDGKVVPCCNDFDYKYILGDLNKSNLMDIWNGNKMHSLRKIQASISSIEIKPCNNCLVPNLSYLSSLELFSPFNSSLFELNSYANKGIYSSEISPEHETHWTEQDFEIFVQDRCGVITFIFQNANPVEESILLKINLYNRHLADIAFKKDERKEIKLDIPGSYSKKLLRFSFHLSHSFVPELLFQTGDERRLGIMLIKIINWQSQLVG